MLRYLCPPLLLLCLGCSPARLLSRTLRHDPAYTDHFTGFALYDPANQRILLQHNADKYFTPASNTKLFSFYAGLMTLGDSIPTLRYAVQHDSLIVWGTGNPLLLNPDVTDTTTLHFLRSRPEKLFLSVANYNGARFGPGWSWDDYNDDYSAEVAPLPVYGNVVRFSHHAGQSALHVSPRFFADSVQLSQQQRQGIRRLEDKNQFFSPTSPGTTQQDVPYRWSPSLAAQLLTDTLHRPVGVVTHRLPANAPTHYGLPTDSLYKRMLVVSDNMLAEHLMLLCASVGDTVSSRVGIQKTIATYLTDLPDRPIWVDGSGLSRYNLFTPRTLTALLLKIYQKVPRERLFRLLPVAGQSGTLRSLPGGDSPFIFAKSGSMTGVYNLSGYLITRKEKLLIFSMMHNNFGQPISEIRQRTGAFLRQVRARY